MTTEKALYQALRRKLPNVHWQRIENWAGSGVPDCNGAFLYENYGTLTGFEIWCELKVCKTKSPITAGLWRPAQIAFQVRRSTVSDGVWNLVTHPRSDTLRIYSGSKIQDLATDSTGSVTPDLVLSNSDPWDSFLDLAARRIREGRSLHNGYTLQVSTDPGPRSEDL